MATINSGSSWGHLLYSLAVPPFKASSYCFLVSHIYFNKIQENKLRILGKEGENKANKFIGVDEIKGNVMKWK